MYDNVVSAINRTVPISQFNRGLAGKIFEEVKHSGSKVVMKNNEAEVVLVSPEEYLRMMDQLEDYKLMETSLERLSHYDPEKVIPAEQVWAELGLTNEEMEAAGEVEFE